MNSNTFENDPSVRGVKSFLEITKTPAGIRITIQESPDVTHGWFAPAQAPAIALAILEAAGVDLNESWSGLDPYGTPSHLGWIGGHLRAYVRQFANDQDKAQEQAELEAEALELCDSARLANGRFKIGNFGLMKDAEKTTWLAVARRAREMRNEKKVTTDD